VTIDKIRARLVACPIPEDALADWDGTNHYEIQSSGPDGWWWLDGLDGFNSQTEEGKRLGAVLDYACAYRKDIQALLAEIDRLNKELPR
jgi:hypothetical protein